MSKRSLRGLFAALTTVRVLQRSKIRSFLNPVDFWFDVVFQQAFIEGFPGDIWPGSWGAS